MALFTVSLIFSTQSVSTKTLSLKQEAAWVADVAIALILAFAACQGVLGAGCYATLAAAGGLFIYDIAIVIVLKLSKHQQNKPSESLLTKKNREDPLIVTCSKGNNDLTKLLFEQPPRTPLTFNNDKPITKQPLRNSPSSPSTVGSTNFTRQSELHTNIATFFQTRTSSEPIYLPFEELPSSPVTSTENQPLNNSKLTQPALDPTTFTTQSKSSVQVVPDSAPTSVIPSSSPPINLIANSSIKDEEYSEDESSKDIIVLSFKGLSGSTYDIKAKGSDKTECIREQLCEKVGSEEITLIFGGREIINKDKDEIVNQTFKNFGSATIFHVITPKKPSPPKLEAQSNDDNYRLEIGLRLLNHRSTYVRLPSLSAGQKLSYSYQDFRNAIVSAITKEGELGSAMPLVICCGRKLITPDIIEEKMTAEVVSYLSTLCCLHVLGPTLNPQGVKELEDLLVKEKFSDLIQDKKFDPGAILQMCEQLIYSATSRILRNKFNANYDELAYRIQVLKKIQEETKNSEIKAYIQAWLEIPEIAWQRYLMLKMSSLSNIKDIIDVEINSLEKIQPLNNEEGEINIQTPSGLSHFCSKSRLKHESNYFRALFCDLEDTSTSMNIDYELSLDLINYLNSNLLFSELSLERAWRLLGEADFFGISHLMLLCQKSMVEFCLKEIKGKEQNISRFHEVIRMLNRENIEEHPFLQKSLEVLSNEYHSRLLWSLCKNNPAFFSVKLQLAVEETSMGDAPSNIRDIYRRFSYEFSKLYLVTKEDLEKLTPEQLSLWHNMLLTLLANACANNKYENFHKIFTICQNTPSLDLISHFKKHYNSSEEKLFFASKSSWRDLNAIFGHIDLKMERVESKERSAVKEGFPKKVKINGPGEKLYIINTDTFFSKELFSLSLDFREDPLEASASSSSIKEEEDLKTIILQPAASSNFIKFFNSDYNALFCLSFEETWSLMEEADRYGMKSLQLLCQKNVIRFCAELLEEKNLGSGARMALIDSKLKFLKMQKVEEYPYLLQAFLSVESEYNALKMWALYKNQPQLFIKDNVLDPKLTNRGNSRNGFSEKIREFIGKNSPSMKDIDNLNISSLKTEEYNACHTHLLKLLGIACRERDYKQFRYILKISASHINFNSELQSFYMSSSRSFKEEVESLPSLTAIFSRIDLELDIVKEKEDMSPAPNNDLSPEINEYINEGCIHRELSLEQACALLKTAESHSFPRLMLIAQRSIINCCIQELKTPSLKKLKVLFADLSNQSLSHYPAINRALMIIKRKYSLEILWRSAKEPSFFHETHEDPVKGTKYLPGLINDILVVSTSSLEAIFGLYEDIERVTQDELPYLYDKFLLQLQMACNSNDVNRFKRLYRFCKTLPDWDKNVEVHLLEKAGLPSF